MSVAQFRDCPGCGEKVHVSKKICPKCGHRKKLRWFHWVFIALAGLFIIGAVSGGENSSKTAGEQSTDNTPRQSVRNEPESQRKFVGVAVSYTKAFRDAKNELQQSSVRKQRRQALAELGLGMRVEGWVGAIKRMETTADGDAAIVVDIGSGIELRTWNNALSDMGTGTLIRYGTVLYETLSQMERGQKITFSGSLFPSNADYYHEISLTLEGSLSEPEFLFKFTEVNKLN